LAERSADERGDVTDGAVVVVGGTAGIGREIAQRYAGRGRPVVITGRDAARATSVAAEIGSDARGIGLDLTEPHQIAGRLTHITAVDHLVLAAIARDANSVREYDVDRATELVTLKLVGYTETVHALAGRLHDDSSILLFGGMAKDRPYPGSTTVTSVNGAVTTMVRTFAIELAPIRVNAVHPGIVGDSPFWAGKGAALAATLERTPTRRLATMEDVTDASVFLLENRSVNGVNLTVDGGWIML
jgi:NAD(P)-dependent dehydrogenase (short-subunit alcohol dehydrogenase family)